jgi:hypothetical protein
MLSAEAVAGWRLSAARSVRPARKSAAEILSATVTPPEALREEGITHWSARLLARWLARNKKIKVSHDSITRLWRRFCLQLHRTEGFKFSTDPKLDAKVRDVVALYVGPPENAVVACADENSKCQAPERSQPILPIRPDIPERQTHDYARHAVTCLPPPSTSPPGTSPTPATPATGTRSSSSSPRRSPPPTPPGNCT